MKGWIILRVKGVTLVVLELVYWPQQRSKKNAIMIRSIGARKNSEIDRRLAAMKTMRLRAWMGIDFNPQACVSFCFHAANMHWMWKSILPVGVRQGS